MTLSHLQRHSYHKPFKCDLYARDAILVRFCYYPEIVRPTFRSSQVGVLLRG